jgi:hypothetical protein
MNYGLYNMENALKAVKVSNITKKPVEPRLVLKLNVLLLLLEFITGKNSNSANFGFLKYGLH